MITDPTKTLISNKELMQIFDITPFQMQDWRKDGMLQPKLGYSFLEDALERLGNKEHLAAIAKPLFAPKSQELRVAITMAQAAEMMDVGAKHVSALKCRGALEGPRGLVFRDSVYSYLYCKQRDAERKQISTYQRERNLRAAAEVSSIKGATRSSRADWSFNARNAY